MSSIFTFGLFVILVSVAGGALRFWTPEGQVLLPAGSWGLMAGAAVSFLSLWRMRWQPSLSPATVAVSILIFLATDWIARDYSFLRGVDIRGVVILGALLFVGSTRIVPLERLARWGVIGAALYLFGSFFHAAQGRFIFSDDHSVVLFRLSMLKENFPFIPFYNPLWNYGLDVRDFFATGTLNIFTLSLPLIYTFEVFQVYHLIIGLLLFLVGPLLTYLAVQLDGVPSRERTLVASIAALLMVTNSLFWYRWALKYGSMGFVTSCLFVLLNIVLVRLWWARDRELHWKEATLIVVSLTLMFFWSMTGILFLPLLLWGVFRLTTVLRKRYSKRLIIVLLCVNLPWVLLFISVSRVFDFVTVTMGGAKQSEATFSHSNVKGKVSWPTPSFIEKKVQDHAAPLNPLVLLFALPGLFMMSRGSSRIAVGAQMAWLCVLGVLVAPLKPQLELDRALIVGGLVAVYPAATFITRFLTLPPLHGIRGFVANLGGAVTVGVLLASVVSVSAIIFNRSVERYTHVPETFWKLGEEITAHAGDGRAVFAGFVLHELGEGHLAPLSTVTQVPLVASSLFHNVWRYTDVIPREFLANGEVGYEEFFDLMNASLVIAHEKKWREYFLARPDRYTFVGRHGVFNLYKRHSAPRTYFLEGSGSVLEQNSSSVKLSLTTPDVVLKFRYFPFLHVQNCIVSPYTVSPSITFVRLAGCPVGTPLTLRARSGFSRLWVGS